jgi:cell wall assembly regulator SMI1
MRLEHLRLQFQERERHGAFSCCVAPPASDEDILEAEQRLNVSFPQQVKMFYQCLNGLRVESPPLEILPIERLHRDSEARLHFATLDGSRQLFFDTSHLNEAAQWDIIGADGFRVTLTMASFWSNKIWAWIDKRRAIWQDEYPPN